MNSRSFGRVDAFTELAEVIVKHGVGEGLRFLVVQLNQLGMSNEEVEDEFPGLLATAASQLKTDAIVSKVMKRTRTEKPEEGEGQFDPETGECIGKCVANSDSLLATCIHCRYPIN